MNGKERKNYIKPLVIASLFVITMLSSFGAQISDLTNINYTIPAVSAATSYDYLVYKSSSMYYVKNAAGSNILSNSDFSKLMNTLNTKLVAYDVVYIQNGVYSVNSLITISKSRVTLIGEDDAILKATSSLTSRIIQIYNGGNYVTFDNLVFDANFNTRISPVVLVGGSYNVIQNCELRNAIQYGIQAWRADHFKFIYNTVRKAQYGFATGGDISKLSSDGLIAYNKIYDCQDCGVKLKWARNVQVVDNYIDVGYLTWTTNRSGSSTTGAAGVRFYTDDGPNYDCSALNNVIVDSKRNRVTTGVMQDADRRLANPAAARSYGLVADGNEITGTYYGLYINKDTQITYSGNIFINIRYKQIV